MLTDCLTVDIDSALASVQHWLREYVSAPHPELGRSGAVCPFVEASQRTGSLEVRIRLLGSSPSTPLLVEALRCALDEFATVPWRGSNPTLWALVVAFPDLPADRLDLLDEAHALIKSETVRRGLMIGQFHDRSDERAAHNPDFRVSHSPVPLAAIRRMAVHDVLFLRERREWFEGYVARFGRRYRTDTQGLDAQYVSLYHQARARFGMIAPGAEPAPGHRLDRAELDRQFSPSRLVPDLAPYLQEYARLSAAARQAHRMRTLNYGDQPEEVLDFFAADPPAAGPPKDSQPADGRPADGPGRVPVQVFVHGGNWQALSQADSGFPAPAFLAAGSAFAAVNYGLAPGHSLDQMVAMVRRAVRWLYTHAGELGIDPERIHLSGSSAGAHLVAMALVDDPDAAEGGVANLVAGAALLSGIYDLEPVRHSYVNDALRLDQAAARRNSPLRHRLNTRTGAPLVIARGGIETDEYIRQHTAMVAAMRRRMPVVDIVRAERDHFDLPYELADPGTELGAAVLRQMGLLTPVVRA